jgi:tetratricopeptide (TPR) repeat protein
VEAAARKLVVDDAVAASAWIVAREPELLHSLHDVAQLIQLGRELREHHPQVALIAHERAVELAERESKSIALVSLAATLRRNQQPQKALRSVEESLGLNPCLDSNVTAHTCRVAILRELGDLGTARRDGEELERRHPDDPYVLRTLAAVYRDLATDDDDLVFRARQLLEHASALAELQSPEWSFSDLVLIEPALVSLLKMAEGYADGGGDRFCAFDVWTRELRPRLHLIAQRQAADPRVQTERAYELVRMVAWRKLPPCRDCGQLFPVE